MKRAILFVLPQSALSGFYPFVLERYIARSAFFDEFVERFTPLQ